MKPYLKYIFFLFFFLISGLGKAKEIVIPMENKPWSPYYFGKASIDSKKPGVMIELLKLVEKKLISDGVKFKFKRYPWKRCLKLLDDSKVDAVLGASFKKSRMEIGHYPMKGEGPDESMGIANSTYSFYKLKSSKVVWNGKTFLNLASRKKIGVTSGYSIADDLKKMNVKVHPGRRSEILLGMVLKNRLSGFAGFTDIVDNILKNDKAKYKKITRSKIPIKKKDYYLIVSKNIFKKQEVLVNKIWSGIKNVRTSKQYQDIELRYRE